MSYNNSWNKWIFASFAKHMKAALDDVSLENFIEGQSTRDLTAEEYVEIRIDGPYYRPHTKNDYDLQFEVNLLVQTVIEPDRNLYRHQEILGVCAQAMATRVPLYKLGPDEADDQTKIGCATLDTQKSPRDLIKVSNFGQIEASVKLQQATVEGKYKVELTGT